MQSSGTRQLSVRLSVLLATVGTVFLLIGGAADAGAPQSPPVEYVVAAGDSLWTIASDHTGTGDDVRSVIAQIREQSGLEGSVIHPGQVLLIPRSP